MAGRNRDRQRTERRREREEWLREAERIAARRRRLTIAGSTLLALVAFGLVAMLLRSGDDGETVAADRDTTTTTSGGTSTTLESAAGKPCVARTDPLPPGAPDVPVKVGPPPTALIKEDLKTGTGAVVGGTDTVKAHYIGVACSTGKIFDSSYSRGQPAEFPLAQVIPGWQQGLPLMKVGGQRLLGIPAELAYGAEGRPPSILPNEALWFVVEVVEAKGPS